MLECKTYNLSEFKTETGITRRVWETRREEILQHLSLFMDYEIKGYGKSAQVEVKQIYADYEPLPSKRDANKMREYYSEQTAEIVKDHPWNTGTCIARNIIAKDKNIYDHKLDTMSRYTRAVVKEEYTSPFQETQWMRLSDDKLTYKPLTEEEYEFLIALFKANSTEGRSQRNIEAYADFKSGYINQEELATILLDNTEKAYTEIIGAFADYFGFRPMKIRHLSKNAITT